MQLTQPQAAPRGGAAAGSIHDLLRGLGDSLRVHRTHHTTKLFWTQPVAVTRIWAPMDWNCSCCGVQTVRALETAFNPAVEPRGAAIWKLARSQNR